MKPINKLRFFVFIVAIVIMMTIAGCQSSQITPDNLTARQLNSAEVHIRDAFEASHLVWRNTFRAAGNRRYRKPNLVVTHSTTVTPCGYNEVNSPFYCPSNNTFYISAIFARDLSRRGANGDKAIGWVVAHEFAHHIQHRLGILHRKQRLLRKLGNRATRINETVADCMASYSIYYAQSKNYLSYSYADISEMVNAAASVGCSYKDCSHGSSSDRTKAVIMGYNQDGLQQCSTLFSG